MNSGPQLAVVAETPDPEREKARLTRELKMALDEFRKHRDAPAPDDKMKEFAQKLYKAIERAEAAGVEGAGEHRYTLRASGFPQKNPIDISKQAPRDVGAVLIEIK